MSGFPLRWRDVYQEAELYKSAIRVYTKPLFHWRKALSTSTDGRNLYDMLVAPTGRRITLRRDRIQNLAEVEAHCSQRVAPEQDWPTPRERQVLNYHKKHKSTSPLYERIRAKYPNW